MSEGNLGSKLLVNKVPFRCTYICIYKQTRQQLKESKWTNKSKDKQWEPKTKWQRKQTKNVNKTTVCCSQSTHNAIKLYPKVVNSGVIDLMLLHTEVKVSVSDDVWKYLS